MENLNTKKIRTKIMITAVVLGGLAIGSFALKGVGSINPVRGAGENEFYHQSIPSKDIPSNPAQAPGDEREKTPTQVLRFALYDVGILPRETKTESNYATLMIDNFSGMSGELELRKENGSGQGIQIGRIENPRGRGRARREFKLTSGRYWLIMTEKPTNKSLIIITAK